MARDIQLQSRSRAGLWSTALGWATHFAFLHRCKAGSSATCILLIPGTQNRVTAVPEYFWKALLLGPLSKVRTGCLCTQLRTTAFMSLDNQVSRWLKGKTLTTLVWSSHHASGRNTPRCLLCKLQRRVQFSSTFPRAGSASW